MAESLTSLQRLNQNKARGPALVSVFSEFCVIDIYCSYHQRKIIYTMESHEKIKINGPSKMVTVNSAPYFLCVLGYTSILCLTIRK